MLITLKLTSTEIDSLSALARADRRTPDAVAELLLRSVLSKEISLRTFRDMVDTLPAPSPETVDQSLPPKGKIDTIIDILTDAKRDAHPLTIDEIHIELVRRCGSGSRNTVTAQLSRLPKERNFEVKRTQSGREARFAAN